MKDKKEFAVPSFYFSCWCKEYEVTQANPWKTYNTTEIQTMEDAAIEFAKTITEREPIIVFVQDWRGRIAKFKITIEMRPVYIARSIK